MEEKNATEPSPKKVKPSAYFFVIALVIVAGAFFYLQFLEKNSDTAIENPAGLAVIQAGSKEEKTADWVEQVEWQAREDKLTDVVDPSNFLSRAEYLKEVFRIRRESYDLFEKAADYTRKDVSEMPKFFSLKNEEEIFAQLTEPAEDFSEIAYLFNVGDYFSIGYLDESYYKQPELYPGFKTLGLRYYTKPDPTGWTESGYSTYPAVQFDTLERGEREEFTGVAFLYASWGVQSFQGVTVNPSGDTLKNFDISISFEQDGKTVQGNTFLLEPSFPKFYKNWAYKVIINGKLKPTTPPGTYAATFEVEIPPEEFQKEWKFEHRTLYINAAQSLKPSGSAIQFNITVK